jgi:LacI family transcriptional regulator
MTYKKITSKDIALNLGISRSVVSFVLNGKNKEMRISDELTKKVLEYVESQKYEPNHMAKSLKTGKSNTIGLIIADISNPFFAKLARFIEIEAFKKKYSVIFCSSDENKKNFLTQLNTLRNRNVDGLILTPPIGSENVLSVLNTQNFPYVVIDRFFEDIPGNYIIVNNHQSAYNATRMFIKNNCKKIALINTNNELYNMNQRTVGYTDALIDSGLKPNAKLIKQLKFSHDSEDVKQAIEKVIETGADAILFTTNKLGVTGIQILQRMGIKIPDEVSVISFDDTEAYSVASTSITAIKQPLEQISIEAVQLLDELIKSKNLPVENKNIILDTEIIVRESCP